MSVSIVKLIDPIQFTNVAGGLVPKGPYNAGTDYAVGDSVDYNGSSYVMYADAAAGTLPTDTTKWQVLANKGDTGAAGADGAPGPAGADGADGLTVSVNSVTQVAGDISLTQDNIPDGTTNKAYTATEQSKLAGIETAADVTDATNVAAAGAIMDGDITGNGLMARTAAGTYTNRTITGTTNQITVTNGDGVGGNPTLALPQDIHTGATPTFAGVTYDGTATHKGNVVPFSDSAHALGTSSLYWKETYTNKLYLNSTATLDGSTAGVVALTGMLDIPVSSTATGQITQNGTRILHTYQGASATAYASIFIGKSSGNFTSDSSGPSYEGTGNVGLGENTLQSLTTGFYNVAIGTGAGKAVTTGYGNFFAAHQSGTSVTTGIYNFFMGRDSGVAATTGSYNIGIGRNALAAVKTTNNNVAIGTYAGSSTTGTANVFIGNEAGRNETGSNKLYIANSNTTTPLIGGDFSTSNLTINGKLNLVASTTTRASLNLASGTAPTSPVDGDIWSDGSDIKVRLGGTTYTLTKA